MREENEPVEDLIPDKPTLRALKNAASSCKGCDLWENATQTVFGEGPSRARLMFIGEQPGNEEDLNGKPFVGPAGRLLSESLAQAGIDRSIVYVTNVVKHFKWEPRGKRRIHKKPNSTEIHACLPWLEAEISLIKPDVVVCLGATAAQALLGKNFRITKQRGEVFPTRFAEYTMATIHPSAILREPDAELRRQEKKRFIEELKQLLSFT